MAVGASAMEGYTAPPGERSVRCLRNNEKRMAQRAFIFLFFVMTATAQVVSGQNQQEQLITALTHTDLKIHYQDGDGASDATVMQTPLPLIRQIINLKAAAIPLLIKHLTDQRLTNATFRNRKLRTNQVTVGYICLDILTSISKGGDIQIQDCADDGLGACYNFRYYFLPDAKPTERKKIQRAWVKAYQTGKIKFQYPAWLK